MEDINLLLPVLFLVVAFVYASVGFGGGSSYIALLSLAALPMTPLRTTALICNIVVVLGNTVLFQQKKHIPWGKTLPLVMASVPLAFWGARMPIRETWYFLLLGVSLIAAAVLLWFQKSRKEAATHSVQLPARDALIGGSIGLLSGVVGIGGGIFLAPVLHFLRWDGSRAIAATASFFILVNSVAGLAGQWWGKTLTLDWGQTGLLALAVLLGGQAGLRYSLHTFDGQLVRRLTALLVLVAGIEILWKRLGVG
jgi:uncharacterized protein